jgi:hypothetical protein
MNGERWMARQLRGLGLALSTLSILLLLLLGGACAGSAGRSGTPGSVPLITEEEAALPAPAGELERGPKEECGPPEIRVESPRGGETYRSPLPVQVRFVPSSGATIDPTSIRVELLKLGFTKDLTQRAREFITAAGISMPSAEVPRGTHRVRISVADTSGKRCSEDVQFTVARGR